MLEFYPTASRLAIIFLFCFCIKKLFLKWTISNSSKVAFHSMPQADYNGLRNHILIRSLIMEKEVSTFAVKKGLAQMLKGGVIMDVVTPEHARIAEDAGAAAVMALERVPADIRADGGVARMSDPELILTIMESSRSRSWPMPHRAFCRSPDPRGAGGGLHRQIRGAHPGR